MKVDIKAKDVAYIIIGDWTIYIDNSTGEKIIETWQKQDSSEDE